MSERNNLSVNKYSKPFRSHLPLPVYLCTWLDTISDSVEPPDLSDPRLSYLPRLDGDVIGSSVLSGGGNLVPVPLFPSCRTLVGSHRTWFDVTGIVFLCLKGSNGKGELSLRGSSHYRSPRTRETLRVVTKKLYVLFLQLKPVKSIIRPQGTKHEIHISYVLS